MPAAATRARRVVGWILVIGVAGLAVWAFIEAVQAEPAIVGSVATAALAVGGVVWQQRMTERERVAEVRRERMAPTYENLLGFVLRGGQSSEQGEPPEDFMKDLKGRQLLLGASSEIIRAFNAWQAETHEAEANGSPLGAIQAYEGLHRAIRKDLGHDDSDLARWDLLRVFINDLDDHLLDNRPLKAVA